MQALVCYYFAMSLDGFIAREDGTVDWLDPFNGELPTPYDYARFYETVDAVVMGRRTCEFVKAAGDYPYPGKPGIVATHQLGYRPPAAELVVVTDHVAQAVRTLKAAHSRRVWLVGGGVLAAEMLDADVLDELIITIVPVTLGSGVPWMGRHVRDRRWRIRDHHAVESGIVQVAYDLVRCSRPGSDQAQ